MLDPGWWRCCRRVGRCVVTNVGPTQESDLHVSVVDVEVGLTQASAAAPHQLRVLIFFNGCGLSISLPRAAWLIRGSASRAMAGLRGGWARLPGRERGPFTPGGLVPFGCGLATSCR